MTYFKTAVLTAFVIGMAAVPDPTEAEPGTVVTLSTAGAKGVSLRARVLPEHLYGDRQNIAPVALPEGYRPAWSDGRLNPRRAEQTLEGHRSMLRHWTSTLPRRSRDTAER